MFNPNFYVESFTISLGETEEKKPKKKKKKWKNRYKEFRLKIRLS